MPLDRLLLETDAPDGKPRLGQPYKEKLRELPTHRQQDDEGLNHPVNIRSDAVKQRLTRAGVQLIIMQSITYMPGRDQCMTVCAEVYGGAGCCWTSLLTSGAKTLRALLKQLLQMPQICSSLSTNEKLDSEKGSWYACLPLWACQSRHVCNDR